MFATHGIFAGDALEKLGAAAEADAIAVTDTVPIDPLRKPDKITVAERVQPARRHDLERLRRRVGVGDLRRREPTLLAAIARLVRRNG